MNQETTNYLRMFATSRRQFLKASAIASGMTATAAFAPAAVAGFALGQASAQEGDLGVLNFALTLEHFESRLYAVSRATTRCFQARHSSTGSTTVARRQCTSRS